MGQRHPHPYGRLSLAQRAQRTSATARAPPREEGGVRETPTGLQRALPHHRGEGAQALRRVCRQAEGVLCVGLEVVHHERRGRVEGPPDLRAGAGAAGETQRQRQRDRDLETTTKTETDTQMGRCKHA